MSGNHERNHIPGRLAFVLWTILSLYALMLIWAFLPMQMIELKKLGGLAIVPAIVVLAALGIAEVIMVLREAGLPSLMRRSLLLMGIATIGTPVSIALHNIVSALLGLWFNAGEEGVFFILGLIVFPLLFIAGAAGTIASHFGCSDRRSHA